MPNLAPVDVQVLQVDLKICGQKVVQIPKIESQRVANGQKEQKNKRCVLGQLQANQKYD